jgi:hypothetical protein
MSVRSRGTISRCAGLPPPSTVRPVPLDEGPALEVGAAVQLAGYGQTGALASDAAVLRSVETAVNSIGPLTIQVGSDSATACRGDSGGVLTKN